jgi:NAD(P)-dependent dehydrogenase (short-subunit alcohol dehydrogenase family)
MAAVDPKGPRVTGRVALVTGASKGIGKATALLLASRGARVMATARSESDLRKLGLDYVAGDLSDPDDCRRVVEETRERLGPIEILVNNAGLGSAEERVVWEQDPKVWHDTMRLNVDGPFYVCRAALPDMVERGYGRCVFVSSTAGVRADKEMSAYCTSKAGLLGLMRSVAQDAGPYGVTSNAVLPGWVRTEMAERSAEADADRAGVDPEEIWRRRGATYPRGTVVTMDEVAEAIAFLASDGASGVNGEEITVALGSHW